MKHISKSVLLSFLVLTLLIDCSSAQENSSGSKADAGQKLSPENVMKKLELAKWYNVICEIPERKKKCGLQLKS